MKNRDFLRMSNALDRIGNVPGSPKFAYWIARNRRALSSIVDSLNEANRPPEEVIPYEEARAELARSLADPNGPNAMQGNVVKIRDMPSYSRGLAELRLKYPNVESLMAVHNEKFEKLLDEEIEKPPEPYLIELELLPAEITGNVVDALFELIRQPGVPASLPVEAKAK